MQHIRFDFNNMFDFNVGKKHGVTKSELDKFTAKVNKAHEHLKCLFESSPNRIKLGLEWTKLPFQDKKLINRIQKSGDEIAKKYENVISLGIGGSYLGLKAAQDALVSPYYNDFKNLRKGRPRIYFEGNNLDPETLSALLKSLNPRKTFVIVISKSGETTETKAASEIIETWLKRSVGAKYGRQIFAITDPKSGTLRKKINVMKQKDRLSFRSLPLLEGVGGRFSELNMGLLHLSIIGIKIQEVLNGAAEMAKICSSPTVYGNPSYMYAVLQTIIYKNKNKPISILMPFSEQLKSTADWYIQLLAESTGKKYSRKIRIAGDGTEEWEQDKNKIVNAGRTPISSRGTNDLHSIQQNNIEGENNKTVTFIRVGKFKEDLKLPDTKDFLAGKSFTDLMKLAQEGTEWSLVKENRPNCTILLPELTAFIWGQLIFFFEMATAFEGELLNINAYNQPGVESYKNYMYYKLKKPGQSKKIAEEIKKSPLIKSKRFII